MRNRSLFCIVAVLLAVSERCRAADQVAGTRSLKGTRPNVVINMPDDISYGAISFYESCQDDHRREDV